MLNQIFTDDTRELNELLKKKDSQIFFLKTPENSSFIESFPKNQNFTIISRDEIKMYFKTNIKIIGITGTNGKTTTSALIYSLLLDLGFKVALLGTRGMFINDKKVKDKGLTTPKFLNLYKYINEAVLNGCEYFVMEVSSHAIKQERIYGLNFEAKILTNIASDHLDYHKNIEDYIETKINFLKSGKCLKFLNLDDKNCMKMRFIENAYGYGIDTKTHLFVDAYSIKNGIFAKLILKNTVRNTENAEINSNMLGIFNLYNILAALLCVKILTKYDFNSIANLISNFAGVVGRMEVVNTEPLIIVDFAHTVDGMKRVFESLKTKKIAVVFGAGGDRDSTKRAKMGHCASLYASKIYITNDNPRNEDPKIIAKMIKEGIKNQKEVKIILDRFIAIETAIKELKQDEVLLILGKGDEEEQIFKDIKIKFNDKICVNSILKK